MNNPLYRTAAIVLIIIGVVVILYYGSPFLQPLAFGAVLAMLLNPLDHRFRSWGIPSYVSIGICVFLVFLFFLGSMALVGWQVAQLQEDWPQIQERAARMEEQVLDYGSRQLNMPADSLRQMISTSGGQLQEKAISAVGGITGALGNFLLVLVYIILFLAERETFKRFFREMSPKENKQETEDILVKSSHVSIQYLGGKLLVMLILGILYAIGFLVAGIKYAILIALIGALLSIIPYVGNIIAGALAIVLALVSGSGFNAALIIVGVMSLAQVIESYVLEPLIVGNQVNLSPFAAIISVIGFSLVWGVGGAIIAIPLSAIANILFLDIPGLRPIGRLLGNDDQDS